MNETPEPDAGAGPEEVDIAGSPEEGQSNLVTENINNDVLPDLSPEGSINDIAKTTADKVYQDSIEQGLAAKEALTAAIKAGRTAALEAGAEISELTQIAEGLSDELITNINEEQIETQLAAAAEEVTETEVAEVADEEVTETEVVEAAAVAEEVTETEVAVAEAAVAEEVTETEVAAAEAAAAEEVTETEVAEAAEDEEVTETEVAEAAEDEEATETEVAEVEVADEEVTETEVAEAAEDEEVIETEVAEVEVAEEEVTETEVAEAAEEVTESESSLIDSAQATSDTGQVSSESIDSLAELSQPSILSSPNLDITSQIQLDAPASEEIQAELDVVEVTEQVAAIGAEDNSDEEEQENQEEINSQEEEDIALLEEELDEGSTDDSLSSSDELLAVSSTQSNNITSTNSANFSSTGSQQLGNLGVTNIVNASFSSPVSSQFANLLETIAEQQESIVSTSDNTVASFSSPTLSPTRQVREEVSLNFSNEVTREDDTLIGGLGDTEFLYDFTSNVSGNDVISDVGNSSGDRIFFKNIPNYHKIIVSRDSDNNQMNIESFNFNSSINTITTPVSNGTIGVEDIYVSVSNENYDDNSSIPLKSFYSLAESDNDLVGGILVGGDTTDTIIGDPFDPANSSSISAFGNSFYDNSDLDIAVIFAKGGNDTFKPSQNIRHIADMGEGNDFIDLRTYGDISDGSNFDGGSGGHDKYWLNNNIQHIGFNSSNYSDSLISTNGALLSEEGTSSNISNVATSYFKNIQDVSGFGGNDTFYVGGDPGDTNIELWGDSGNDKFTVNSTELSTNMKIYGNSGDDEVNIDSYSSSGYLNIYGGTGADTFNFNTSIVSESVISVYGDNSSTTSINANNVYKFSSNSSNNGLNINGFSIYDNFEFSSSAFSGSQGHVLVYGQVSENSFVLDNSNAADYSAFDQNDNRILDVSQISTDYWYYNTDNGDLFYDEDADQDMTDAVQIANVKSFNSVLNSNQFTSSDIEYT